MDLAVAFYLGSTFLLLAIFSAIVLRTCSRKGRERGESPKYRMMEDD